MAINAGVRRSRQVSRDSCDLVVSSPRAYSPGTVRTLPCDHVMLVDRMTAPLLRNYPQRTASPEAGGYFSDRAQHSGRSSLLVPVPALAADHVAVVKDGRLLHVQVRFPRPAL
jgi:hypothetical protein